MSTMDQLFGLIALVSMQFLGSIGQLGVPCDKTEFGCCGDAQTAAKGPNKEGCPGTFNNILPSFETVSLCLTFG